MSADPVSPRPRVTKAVRFDELQKSLESLLAFWDSSKSEIVWSTAGQLRKAMRDAEANARAPQADWDQANYERRLTR